MSKYFKHRGVEGLVIARVINDDNETDGGYKTEPPKPLAPVARIGKTVEASNAAEYYDNVAMFVIGSEGPDEFELDTTAFPLELEAELTGKGYDPMTGALIDGVPEERYFALGYKTKGNDGGYRYVWRLKVKFSPIDKEHTTENDGTDTTGPTLKCTGVHTVHKFTKGYYDSSTTPPTWYKGTVKGVVIDSRDDKVDTLTFFATVQTPDTLKAKTAT